ncbi:MAG: DUF1501 domain-containing protein, partial [Planctomycetaceae bacterium]
LVIWGGEFGRTPFIQGDINNRPRWGRDHHPYAFTVWLAGGGVREGLSWGASDDLGINVAERGVHVHDLQATILHQLGIDHERLTFRFQGRQFRLTDIFGEVVQGILKNGAVSGAEVPGLVPFSFPRIVTVFLFLHSWSPGTGSRTGAKTEVHKRKETPRELGVSGINAAF